MSEGGENAIFLIEKIKFNVIFRCMFGINFSKALRLDCLLHELESDWRWRIKSGTWYCNHCERLQSVDGMISELFTRPSNVTCTKGFSDCHRNSFFASLLQQVCVLGRNVESRKTFFTFEIDDYHIMAWHMHTHSWWAFFTSFLFIFNSETFDNWLWRHFVCFNNMKNIFYPQASNFNRISLNWQMHAKGKNLKKCLKCNWKFKYFLTTLSLELES